MILIVEPKPWSTSELIIVAGDLVAVVAADLVAVVAGDLVAVLALALCGQICVFVDALDSLRSKT